MKTTERGVGKQALCRRENMGIVATVLAPNVSGKGRCMSRMHGKDKNLSRRARRQPSGAKQRKEQAIEVVMDQMYGKPLQWLTAKQAAQHLKVDVRTLLQWTRQGKVKGYALSGTKRRVWRFLYADLDAMLVGPAVLSGKERAQ